MLTVPVVWGETYQCMDATGTVIYTDSPSQLTRCVAAPPPPSSSTRREEVNRTQEGGQSPFGKGTVPVEEGGQSPDGRATVPLTRGEGGKITVPVTKVGRSLVVLAKLNNQREAKLIVDTGAEITVLSHAVALDAGLLPSQTVATVTLNTAGGSVRADVFRVGSVSLGSAEARNVAAAVHDLPDAPAGVDGLLGLTFLDQFLVTVDAKKGELHLQPRR